MNFWKKLRFRAYVSFKHYPATLGAMIGNIVAFWMDSVDGLVFNGIYFVGAVLFETLHLYHQRKFQKLLDDLNINITLAEAIIEAEKPDWKQE